MAFSTVRSQAHVHTRDLALTRRPLRRPVVLAAVIYVALVLAVASAFTVAPTAPPSSAAKSLITVETAAHVPAPAARRADDVATSAAGMDDGELTAMVDARLFSPAEAPRPTPPNVTAGASKATDFVRSLSASVTGHAASFTGAPPTADTRVELLVEQGVASTYGMGDGFQGNLTACGLVFDTYVPQVAHKSLPCGTTVRIEDLHSGNSVTVQVTDRGPYIPGRVVDLSWAAFRELEPAGPGLLNVRVYTVDG